MGGRPLEGLTMVGKTLGWTEELERWLKPFLNRLAHKARRRMCPLYVAGLIGPGERKSIQPMAERLVPGAPCEASRKRLMSCFQFQTRPGSNYPLAKAHLSTR